MDDVGERIRLLTYFANSYSSYFKSDEISHELSKLEEFVEESVVKLDELQSLFEMVSQRFNSKLVENLSHLSTPILALQKKESENKEWTEKIVPAILQQNKSMVDIFNKRLEFLLQLTQSLKETLDTLETQISQAEQAFGLTSSFRSVLNYFRRPVEPAMMVHTLENTKFVPITDINIDSKFISS